MASSPFAYPPTPMDLYAHRPSISTAMGAAGATAQEALPKPVNYRAQAGAKRLWGV
jgi:hypothetical protein